MTTDEKREALEEEIRLDGFLTWVWRGKWLIIILVIVASGAALVTGLRQPELHSAAALIEVGRVWGKPLKDIYATAEVANSPGFIQEVAGKIGVRQGQLARAVDVGAVESGLPHSLYPILIKVTARTETADESVRLAQAMADEIIARHDKVFEEALAPHLEEQRGLEQQLKDAPSGSEIALKIKTRLDEVKASNTSPTSTEKTHLAEKVVPGSTTRPSVWRGTATAGLIAAVVGVAAVCLFGYFRPTRL